MPNLSLHLTPQNCRALRRGNFASQVNFTLERMNTLAQQLEKADRLATVIQSVGFALWQLQELEGVTVQHVGRISEA